MDGEVLNIAPTSHSFSDMATATRPDNPRSDFHPANEGKQLILQMPKAAVDVIEREAERLGESTTFVARRVLLEWTRTRGAN